MDFVLERLNKNDKSRFIIDRNEEFVLCGRGHINKINCNSQLVSRKHCMFFRRNDELYVADFGSSNGIYINDVKAKPLPNHTKLNENDIIRIGCEENNTNSDKHYIFRVYKLGFNEEVMARRTSNNDKSPEVAASCTNRVVGKKCKSDSTCCNEVPCKIKYNKKHNDSIDLKESTSKASNNNKNPHNSHDTNDLIEAKTHTAEMTEYDDIEIIHTSLKVTSNGMKSPKDVNNCVVENSDSLSPTSSPKYLNNNNKSNLNHKTVQDPTMSHKNCNSDELMDISDEDMFDNYNKKDRNNIYTKKISNNIDKRNDSSNIMKNSNSTHANDKVKKKKNEQRRMSSDEKATSVNCKKTHHESSIKSKKIKQELKTFSQIDVIDISDDEDGLFPYSQLFDSKLEEDAECKVKMDCESNDDQNVQKNNRPDEDDEVVILSDNEDENNPWLERLSRSQIIKEEEEGKEENFNSDNVIVKEEIDLGIWDSEDEITQLFQKSMEPQFSKVLDKEPQSSKVLDEEPQSSKVLDEEPQSSKVLDEEPQSSKVLDKIDAPNELDKNIEDKNKDEDNNSISDSIKDAMEIDDADPLKNREPSLGSASDTSKEKRDVEQDTNKLEEPDKQDKLDKEKVESKKQKLTKERKTVTTPKKLIPVIEAPYLSKRRKQIDHSKDKTPKACEKKSPIMSKLEEKKKSANLKTKLNDTFYGKEHKQKEIPKSPDYHSSEPKAGPSNISRDEKRIINEKRKEKLKEIEEKKAEEKKLAAEKDQNVPRRIAKPRAKVSIKNRGDFLIAEQAPSVSKSLPDKSKKVPKSSINSSKQLAAQDDVLKKSSHMKRNQAKAVSEDTTSDMLLQQTTEVPKTSTSSSEDCLTNQVDVLKKSTSHVRKNQAKDVSKDTESSTSLQSPLQIKPITRLIDNSGTKQVSKDDAKMVPKWHRVSDREKKHSKSKETKRSTEDMFESRDKSTERASTSLQERTKESSNGLKSNLVRPEKISKTKTKKRVTFVEKPFIREYYIDSHNSMRKLKGKDAPIPADKLKYNPTVSSCVEWAPKLEEFLLRIFMWNPMWLDEQRSLNKEPPILNCEIQPMKFIYSSCKEYYDIAMPLLLHEIWYTMSKEFEKNMQHPTMICSIVQNSITRVPISTTNLFLMTMMIEVLVDRRDFDKPMHPLYGDLVVLQLNRRRGGCLVSSQMFAYVTNRHETIITNFTHYNRDLRQHVKHPYAVITYTLLMRTLDFNIPVDQMHRVRTVMYLRANMRMVQALQYLPQSPLKNPILNPNLMDYHLSPTPHAPTPLISKNNLNPKQLEAVFRVTQTVLNRESKMCFIQGPPGTGKSKVIVNLVTQILYNQRANKKPLKILVCAPSNAAIDEIALRLLNIRSSLKEDGKNFKMVRVGKPETIHPSIKNISLKEIAERYFHEKVLQRNSPRYNEDITHIKAEMEQLRIKAQNPHLSEIEKQALDRKLYIAKMDYEIKKCGKTIEEFTPKERSCYQRMAENLVLTNADIITCTLSSCYTNLMESTFGFNKKMQISVCIVDEATQSCEAETLIPLMLGVNTLVLVGDPNQLPATILSQRAKRLGLDRSIFSRVQNVFASQPNSPIIMLNMQYRMIDSISYWPNKYFYGGKLKNGIQTNYNTCFPLHGYKVLEHNFAQNDDKFSNSTEALLVANIIYVMLMFPKWKDGAKITIGILTPYNNQKTLVLQKVNERLQSVPDRIKKKIIFEVNTVDSFQGQERDVIIMSCVRSDGIGFLSDRQRLCVALTRAKSSLIICGNFKTFKKDLMWQTLLTDARTRGHLCHVKANTETIIKKLIIK